MEEKEMTPEESKARISELEKEVAAANGKASHYEQLYGFYKKEAESYYNIIGAVNSITALAKQR